MRMSALFEAKNSDFLKFLVCPHGQGLSYYGQAGRGSIFRDFVRKSFMDGLLIDICEIYYYFIHNATNLFFLVGGLLSL